MTIFGKPLARYVARCRPFLILILLVGAARLALSLGGVPNTAARWISITAIMWIAVLYYAVRIPASGFGSYRHLLAVLAILNLAGQAIVILGIVIAMITGNGNIYSAPEYAFGSDGATWLHLCAHLFLGTTAGTLVPWIFGSLIMFVYKKVGLKDRNISGPARA